jgi:dihydrodipicolinate synthase/N-acetylneuraminate lyase
MKKKFGGIVVPAITPLTSDLALDHEAVEKMFARFRQSNVKPFIMGTTGESASLPMSLKHDFIQTAAKLKQSGDVLYAGISSNCLDESVDLAKRCFDAGIDIVAATLPTYYTLSAEDMKKYFEQLANQVPGPLIIYNIPATTHMSIPLEVIDELSHHENIVGTKDSERSQERLDDSLRLWANRPDFCYFLGWAAQSAHALINGSDGLIPSTGNLFPQIYSEMLRAVDRGDKDTAFRYQQLSDLFGGLYQSGRLLGSSLAALKVLMQTYGICQPYMMPPLQVLSEEDAKSIRTKLNELVTTEEITIEEVTL